jgi:hyperosmotically inducible periplasmic protein
MLKMMTLRRSGVSILMLAALTFGCSQTDVGVTTKIKASLAVDKTVDASHIEVATRDKVVTLTGNINSQAEKDRALQIARSTKGVTDVVDMIAVRTSDTTGSAPDPGRTVGETIDDATITAKVKSRLLDDPQVKGLKIDVDTREGVVFLTGEVGTRQELDRAVEIAKATEHVKDVRPNLMVTKG